MTDIANKGNALTTQAELPLKIRQDYHLWRAVVTCLWGYFMKS